MSYCQSRFRTQKKPNRESLFLTFEYKSVAIWYWAERKRKTSILLTFFMPSFHINTIPNVTWLWNFTARVFCLTFFAGTWKRIPPSEVEWLISAMTSAGIRRDWKKSKRFYQRMAAFDVSREFSEDEQRTALFGFGIFLLACVITRTRWIWMKNLFIVCLFNIESILNHFLLCCENNSLGSMRSSDGLKMGERKIVSKKHYRNYLRCLSAI